MTLEPIASMQPPYIISKENSRNNQEIFFKTRCKNETQSDQEKEESAVDITGIVTRLRLQSMMIVQSEVY